MIKFDGMFVTEEHLKNAFESTLPEADHVTLLVTRTTKYCFVGSLTFRKVRRAVGPVGLFLRKKITKPSAAISSGRCEKIDFMHSTNVSTTLENNGIPLTGDRKMFLEGREPVSLLTGLTKCLCQDNGVSQSSEVLVETGMAQDPAAYHDSRNHEGSYMNPWENIARIACSED